MPLNSLINLKSDRYMRCINQISNGYVLFQLNCFTSECNWMTFPKRSCIFFRLRCDAPPTFNSSRSFVVSLANVMKNQQEPA